MRKAALAAAWMAAAFTLPGLAGCGRARSTAAIGDPRRGARIIGALGCGSCHQIAGIANADGRVGPPLSNMGGRTVIAGVLPNTPQDMERWLLNPQAIVPGNAMPATGLTPSQAADVTAYLEALR